MTVGVLWRKGDEPKVDVARWKVDVVVMEKDFTGHLDRGDHVRVPKRVCITRKDLEHFGFTAKCLGYSEEPRDKHTH